MLIRSKNRQYIFDRHISDAFLRLSVIAVMTFFALSSFLLLIYTDHTIDAAFWVRFQNLLADLAGKESTKLGTSERSIYTTVIQKMEQEGALLTEFPTYADKISPNNQAVEMIKLKLRDLRLVVRALGFLALGVTLFLLLVARIIYGNGQSRFRLIRNLYLFFNQDTRNRQPQGSAHLFSAIQRKVFEVAFAASKGNPDGSFTFDFLKFYKQIWPGEDAVGEIKRGALLLAFTDLCEDYFYFPIPFNRSFVLRAYCPVVPLEEHVERTFVRDLTGQEVEVFSGGRFRFSPPLFEEYLRGRYSKLPHPVCYGLDDRKHPFGFRIYLYLWEKYIDLKQSEEHKIIGFTMSTPLFDLLENVCVELSYGQENNLLESFHGDLNNLKEAGLIRGWFIEEHGAKVNSLWYKDAEIFIYDAATNTNHRNTAILRHKIYFFELTPSESLDKIKIVKRRCAYLDEFDTPCTRPALPHSPYCKRHAKVLEYDGTRVFQGKVKALEPPPDQTDNPKPETPASPEPKPATPPDVIFVAPTSAPDADKPVVIEEEAPQQPPEGTPQPGK